MIRHNVYGFGLTFAFSHGIDRMIRNSLWGPAFALLIFGFASADEPETVDWEKRFRESAQKYKITLGEKRVKLDLLDQPILNWSNPQRKTSAGALFIWTNAGRPAAALCIYPNESGYDHEFQSLSLLPMQATRDGSSIWNPIEPGLSFKSMESDAITPGLTGNLRLRQMRQLARAFQATVGAEEKKRQPLRLLPAPIYRYPKQKGDGELVDGALFGFVQGTDPEILLLIEAVQDSSAPQNSSYRYALARMSMVPLQVSHARRPIWETNWASVRNSVGPYFTIQDLNVNPPVAPN